MTAFVPHAYQEDVIERMRRQERLGLFLDPGLGKTAITLEAFRRLREDFEVSRALVVAPLRPCYSVWPAEAAKWDQFRDLRVRVLHGAGRCAAALRDDADVYVINPEGLKWLVRQRWRVPDMLVVDESTRFKRKSARRSALLDKVRGRFARRYVLTGTPAPNGLADLHGQVRILDDGAALGDTMEEFRAKYCAPVPTGAGYWTWKVRTSKEPEIYRAIEPLVVRLDARDHLDLPDLVTVDVPLRLPARAREIYDRLQRDMVTHLERGDVVAQNAGALTAKCRQVANGSVYLTPEGEVSDREERRWEVVHRAKAEALADLVEELGGKPLLVAYEHRHEVPVIRQALRPILGADAPRIGGGTSAAEGLRLEREWNAGRLRVLLVHPASVGHGMNLQAGGAHLAWYSIPWDLEWYDQTVRRLWRQGQGAGRVVVHRLVAEDTVDGVVAAALRRKDATQASLLDALRAFGVPTSRGGDQWGSTGHGDRV